MRKRRESSRILGVEDAARNHKKIGNWSYNESFQAIELVDVYLPVLRRCR